MLFIPKKFKYKKQQKGGPFNRIKGNINFIKLKFGKVGLKAQTFNRITSKQLVTLKQSVKKILKKRGKLKIDIFSFTSITKKAIGVRMGKGKGFVDHWVFKIRPGSLLCEIATNSIPLAVKALNNCRNRLPIFTKIVFF